MRNGLEKTVDSVRAIFYSHSRGNMDPGMEGWAEIDHVVA